MKGRAIVYSSVELQFIEKNKELPRRSAHARFCDHFGRDYISLTNYNALCKRKGWMTGRTGQYKPGATPMNKGKKMPYNANCTKTQFKKGRLPHNTKGPGHETTCPKDSYIYMIVAETNP